MKSKLKKSLSLLLSLVMAMSCMSLGAFAEGETAKFVARVGETEYTDIQKAIAVAMTGDDHTVTLLRDVEVDTWYQNVIATAKHYNSNKEPYYDYREEFSSYIGTKPSITEYWPDELTIIGGGHTLKINSVCLVNGSGILNGFQKLNISNLTMTIESPNSGGISMYSGVIDGVTFNINGRSAIFTYSGETDSDNNRIEIKNCTFNDYNSYAIYSAEDGSASSTIISNNTFNTGRAVIVRGDTQFENNVVNCAEGITVAGNANNAAVCGNFFVAGKDRSMKLYQASNTKIEGNVILSKIELDSKATAVDDLSKNYWGGGEPKNLPDNPVTPTYSSYYTDANDLPTATSVGANFTLSNPAYVVSSGSGEKEKKAVVTNVAKDDTFTNETSSTSVESYVNVAQVLANAVAANSDIDVSSISSMTLSLKKTGKKNYSTAIAVPQVVQDAAVSFEVHPVATVKTTTNGETTETTYDVSNDELATGASFTFTLPLGIEYAGKRVTLSHYSSAGVKEGDSWTTLADASGNVTVTLDKFSYITVDGVDYEVFGEIYDFDAVYGNKNEFNITFLYDESIRENLDGYAVKLYLDDNGTERELTETSGSDYLNSDITTYKTDGVKTGSSGAKYQVFTVKMFAKYFASDIIVKLVKEDTSVNITSYNNSAFGIEAEVGTQFGYSMVDFIDLKIAGFNAVSDSANATKYTTLKSAITAYGSALSALE